MTTSLKFQPDAMLTYIHSYPLQVTVIVTMTVSMVWFAFRGVPIEQFLVVKEATAMDPLRITGMQMSMEFTIAEYGSNRTYLLHPAFADLILVVAILLLPLRHHLHPHQLQQTMEFIQNSSGAQTFHWDFVRETATVTPTVSFEYSLRLTHVIVDCFI